MGAGSVFLSEQSIAVLVQFPGPQPAGVGLVDVPQEPVKLRPPPIPMWIPVEPNPPFVQAAHATGHART